MMYRIPVLLFLLSSFLTYGQTPDSFPILEYSTFLQLVQAYHPAAQQAELLIPEGELAVMGARGQFDPRLGVSLKEKDYDDKPYYNLFDAGLLIPTNLGIDVQAGFEQTDGQFLNPERSLPDEGQMALGLSVPVLHQIVINERRLQMQQARLIQQATLLERQQLLNALFFEAAVTYWEWAMSYHKLRIYNEAVAAARLRLQAVRQSAELGDVAPIDSVEARTQVQQFEIERLDARLKFQKQTLKVSNFLWSPEGDPLRLSFGSQAPAIDSLDAYELRALEQFLPRLDQLLSWHPNLLFALNKQERLQIDRRLKLGKTLPKVKLNFLLLSNPANLEVSPSDYRLSAGVQYPLFTRRERADLRLADLKLRQVALEIQFKQQSQENKILTAWYSADNARSQITAFRNQRDNFLILLEGEQEKFFLGQSSLFLINSREQKYIKSRLEWVDSIFQFYQQREKLEFELFSRVAPGAIPPGQ